MGVKVSFLEAGYTMAHRSLVLGGLSLEKKKFPATVAVIEHPKHGIALFDTGYSPKFLEQTRYFPNRFYALITPVTIDREGSAVGQLEKRGIRASDVRKVILSHFHADHIAGISDFPNAEYVYMYDAYEYLRQMSDIGALKHAFLKGLLPDDFKARSRVIAKDQQTVSKETLYGLSQGHDLFGDGSVITVRLPGHARGHMGLMIEAESGNKLLLVGDAAWTTESIERNVAPNKLTKIFFDDYEEYQKTLRKLHDLGRVHLDLNIVPCHCEKKVQAVSHG